ncbi:MAG: RNA polymerase subunit alpha domain protein [Planctomycetes bacterium]|nr:RNA polymerase subunit alpha domain protein [Planctomycetota bacterium]MCC7172910.1 RNA polymerase subunit alpha domain protein [Planctomycetota bacterium]
MAQDVALEINVEELLRRDPLTVSDCMELRRELFRTDSARENFLALLEQKYPSGARDPEVAFRRGVGLYCAGRVAAAQPILLATKHALAQYLVGQAALDRNDLIVAKAALEKVGGSDQPNEYRMAYGDLLARIADEAGLEKLIALFRKADAEGADTAFLEGRLEEIRGSYAQAVALYERAVSIQPDHRGARFYLAYRLDLLGRDVEAIQHYERLKQVFPVSIGALLNLGLLYEDAESYDRASSCYKLVLAADGSSEIARMFYKDAEVSYDMYYDEEKERKDDKRAQILKIPVTDFELSVRSRNCLARMNIRSLGDLIRKTEAELLSFKNFGETSLNEIKEILRSKGLRLGMQSDDDDRRRRTKRPVDLDAVRSKGVAELDLSVRSRKALDNLGVGTVGQLCEISEEQLLACKNFGQTSMNEIKKKLADLGLSLRS